MLDVAVKLTQLSLPLTPSVHMGTEYPESPNHILQFLVQ